MERYSFAPPKAKSRSVHIQVEALAYFVRKFEALASEVALTAARITSGAMVPQDAHETVKKLRQQVRELNGVGDLDSLAQSVEQIEPLIEGNREAYEAKKAAESAVKAARREQILVEKLNHWHCRRIGKLLEIALRLSLMSGRQRHV